MNSLDAVIKEFADLGAEIKRLQARRAEIVEQLGVGRTEGDSLAIYVSGRGVKTSYSVFLLKRYVPKATLDMCEVSRFYHGSAKIVPKLKPKKPKKGANAKEDGQ